MKKILLIILIFTFILSGGGAMGKYNVETDDDIYVSDEIYINPYPSWDSVPAEKIYLNQGKAVFYAGEKNEPFKIEASVMPFNTTDKTITYKTSDISVASVDSDGVVTCGNSVGDAVIEMRCSKAYARFKVSVINGVKGVMMSRSTMTLYADKPMTAQLSAIISPSDASIKDVKWYSEDNSIAFVDKEGLVSPCGVGTTDVYAETVDGGYKAKCTVTVTTWEKRKEDIPIEYSDYDISLEEMVSRQMDAAPTIFTNAVYAANEENVEQYANPANLVTGYNKYQFIDLSSSNGIDAETLDSYLKGKGILEGMGRVFKDAAESNGLSEVYLVIHACLETGNGTSALASGIEYGGKGVYNMFGIGAVDASPVESGVKYAYEQGWTSVEKAIRGGARWISENYVNNSKYKQNTLYKMRWNPDYPGVHQYATDIAWASKQAKDMSNMFEAFPTAQYRFEIPVFSDQEKPEIR